MLVGNYTMLAGFLNTMRVANDQIVGGGSMFFRGNDAQKNRGKPYAVPGAGAKVPRIPMLTESDCDPREEVKKEANHEVPALFRWLAFCVGGLEDEKQPLETTCRRKRQESTHLGESHRV